MKHLASLIIIGFLATSCQSNSSSTSNALTETLNVSSSELTEPIVSPENTTISSILLNTGPPNSQMVEPGVYTIPRERKTFLINGLASAVPFIGYGFTNLSKKIKNGKLYSYVTPVEGSVYAGPAVLKEILAAYSRNPNVEINLIGISYGANLVSRIAVKLHRKNIPVHYLGTIEGTSLLRIRSNVRTADNFTCTYLDCTRAKARLARGNQTTRLNSYKFKSSHIPLGDNAQMHSRVLRRIAAL